MSCWSRSRRLPDLFSVTGPLWPFFFLLLLEESSDKSRTEVNGSDLLDRSEVQMGSQRYAQTQNQSNSTSPHLGGYPWKAISPTINNAATQASVKAQAVSSGAVFPDDGLSCDACPSSWRTPPSRPRVSAHSRCRAFDVAVVWRSDLHLVESGSMKEELASFRRKLSDAGRASYAARTGASDDLVLAVAIACWW